MKNYFLLLLAGALFTSSCTTDFDLTSDWKDVTIVIGLLDKSDTAQYIKINKAFLDQSTSALEIAQISDSLYYNNIVVTLDQLDGNGNVISSMTLTKVDGNLEGFVKDTGTFANTPNYLYKTTQPLVEGPYKITVTKSDEGKTVTAYTNVIGNFNVTRPNVVVEKVNFIPSGKYNVQWYAANYGKIYDLTIRFHFEEQDINTSAVLRDTFIDWNVFHTLVASAGQTNFDYSMLGATFYNIVHAKVQPDALVKRIPLNLDFMFSVGGEELYKYYLVNNAQTGITSGQIQPEYTNIENGLGIYSSRFHKNLIGVQIDPRTVDSLACNNQTKDLNFIKSNGSFCF